MVLLEYFLFVEGTSFSEKKDSPNLLNDKWSCHLYYILPWGGGGGGVLPQKKPVWVIHPGFKADPAF
jgi:hypothetical protein